MVERIVSLNTAMLARQKGFNVATYRFYNKNGDVRKNSQTERTNSQLNYWKEWDKDNEYYSAPSQGHLQQWLREKHNIHIFIGYRMNAKKWDSHSYDLNLNGVEYIKTRPLETFMSQKVYDSYDDALEAGLIEALNNINIEERNG